MNKLYIFHKTIKSLRKNNEPGQTIKFQVLIKLSPGAS